MTGVQFGKISSYPTYREKPYRPMERRDIFGRPLKDSFKEILRHEQKTA